MFQDWKSHAITRTNASGNRWKSKESGAASLTRVHARQFPLQMAIAVLPPFPLDPLPPPAASKHRAAMFTIAGCAPKFLKHGDGCWRTLLEFSSYWIFTVQPLGYQPR